MGGIALVKHRVYLGNISRRNQIRLRNIVEKIDMEKIRIRVVLMSHDGIHLE